ncbi:hypothetical protein [Rhodoblastus sp.]|uniref:hypothetical protein n=1 Tax=Rhodoblastus sp. TaxID=1962975 RepID=UPI003F9A7244
MFESRRLSGERGALAQVGLAMAGRRLRRHLTESRGLARGGGIEGGRRIDALSLGDLEKRQSQPKQATQQKHFNPPSTSGLPTPVSG